MRELGPPSPPDAGAGSNPSGEGPGARRGWRDSGLPPRATARLWPQRGTGGQGPSAREFALGSGLTLGWFAVGN